MSRRTRPSLYRDGTLASGCDPGQSRDDVRRMNGLMKGLSTLWLTPAADCSTPEARAALETWCNILNLKKEGKTNVRTIQDFMTFVLMAEGADLNTLDSRTKTNTFEMLRAFVLRLNNLLMVRSLAGLSAKVLYRLTRAMIVEFYQAPFACEFYETVFMSHKDLVKVFDTSQNDYQVISSFLKLTRLFVSVYFKAGSAIKTVPKFVRYLLLDLFPDITARQFKVDPSNTKTTNEAVQWKVMRRLVDAADDLAVCDKEYVMEIHNNERFVMALVTMITTAMKKNKKSEGKDQTLQEFVAAAKFFLKRVLLVYLRNSTARGADVSFLCKYLFDMKPNSPKLCKYVFDIRTQDDYDLLELLCEVAWRIGNVWIDAFCPEKFAASKDKNADMAHMAAIMYTQTVFADKMCKDITQQDNEKKAKLAEMLKNFERDMTLSDLRLANFAASFRINFGQDILDAASIKELKALLFPSAAGSERRVESQGREDKAEEEQEDDKIAKGEARKLGIYAELLKYFTCIRNKEGPSAEQYDLSALFGFAAGVIDVHKSWCSKKDEGTDNPALSFEGVDLEQFRTTDLHPSDEESWYYDLDLVEWWGGIKWRMEGAKRDIGIRFVQKLNVIVFFVDCLNEFLSAVDVFCDVIRAQTNEKQDQRSGGSLTLSWDDAKELVTVVCQCDRQWAAWPETTMDLLFGILDKVDLDIEYGPEVASALLSFLMAYPMASVFRFCTECFKQWRPEKDTNETERVRSNSEGNEYENAQRIRERKHWDAFEHLLKFLRHEKVHQFIIEKQSLDALDCLVEVCHRVFYGSPELIERHRESSVSVIAALVTLLKKQLETELCAPILDLIALVCAHPFILSHVLYKERLFDFLFYQRTADQVLMRHHAKGSPVWTSLFSLLLTLPRDSPVIWECICRNFDLVAFLLMDRDGSTDSNLASTKRVITDIFVWIADSLLDLSEDGNTFYHKTVRLIIRLLSTESQFFIKCRLRYATLNEVLEHSRLIRNCVFLIYRLFSLKEVVPVELGMSSSDLKDMLECVEKHMDSVAEPLSAGEGEERDEGMANKAQIEELIKKINEFMFPDRQAVF